MTTTERMVAAVLAVALAGCGADGADEAPEAVGGASVATEVAAPEAPALSDPEIAHVAVTANTIDVEMGRMAESRAASEEVRAFARTMITDHTAVNEQAAALAQRLGVTPLENDVSRSLQADAERARAELESLSGAAFDGAYIDREIAYHQAVLDALDDTLIPSASNAELRGLLEQVRPAIEAHLERARSLEASANGR